MRNVMEDAPVGGSSPFGQRASGSFARWSTKRLARMLAVVAVLCAGLPLPAHAASLRQDAPAPAVRAVADAPRETPAPDRGPSSRGLLPFTPTDAVSVAVATLLLAIMALLGRVLTQPRNAAEARRTTVAARLQSR